MIDYKTGDRLSESGAERAIDLPHFLNNRSYAADNCNRRSTRSYSSSNSQSLAS